MSLRATSIGLPPRVAGGQPVPKEIQDYLDRLRRGIREPDEVGDTFVLESLGIAFYAAEIDIRTLGSTILGTVPTGQRLLSLGCYGMLTEIDASSGTTTGAINIVNGSTTLRSSVAVGGSSTVGNLQVLGGATANNTVLNDAGDITLTVTTAATCPTCKMVIGILGLLISSSPDGFQGANLLSGAGSPSDATDGEDGDFWIDTSTWQIYGPKTSGAWGSPTSLIGPGAEWKVGSGAPGGGLGDDGDLYLDLATGDVYGPKAGGAWGASVGNIQGPTGPTGPTGPINGSGSAGQVATWVDSDTLTGSLGTANQVLGVNSGATGTEFKTLTASTAIGITHGAGTVTIAVNDAELVALAGLASGADLVPIFTGSGTASTFTVTAAARTVLDDTTVGAMLATIGGIGGRGNLGAGEVAYGTDANTVDSQSQFAYDSTTGQLTIAGISAGPLLMTRAGTGAQTIGVCRNTQTATVGAGCLWSFQALNDAGSSFGLAAIVASSGVVTSGSEEGKLQFRVTAVGNAARVALEIDEGNDWILNRLNNTNLTKLTPTGFRVGDGTDPTAKLDVLQATLGSLAAQFASTATNDDPTLNLRQGRVATTNATVTTLTGCTYTPAASTTTRLRAEVVARRTGGTAGTAENGAVYVIEACYKVVAGVPTLIGTVTTIYSAESDAAWDCTFDVSGADVRVRVTGATNNNITWHGNLWVQPVGT